MYVFRKKKKKIPGAVFHEQEDGEVVQPRRQLRRVGSQGPLPDLHALSVTGFRLPISAVLDEEHRQHVRLRRNGRVPRPEHSESDTKGPPVCA